MVECLPGASSVVRACSGQSGREKRPTVFILLLLFLLLCVRLDSKPALFIKKQITLKTLDEWNRRYKENNIVTTTIQFFPDAIRAYSVLKSLDLNLTVQMLRSSVSGGVSLGAHLVCARVAGLTDKQRAMCRSSPAAIAAVGDGLRMAYAECREQLSGYRWNCSGVGDGNDFGHVMPLATREAAFTYAITSAGVTHALSSACARGDLPACHCNSNRRRITGPSEQFQWGGCGEAAYGMRFARRFLDARELEADARSLMNLHNNRVGRKVSEIVKDLVRRECKCHGVSGSCALRTCWRALPPFRTVAAALRDRYHRAKMVTVHPPPATNAPHSHLVIRRPRQNAGIGRQPRKSELVFLEPSPSYCEPDTVSGSLGTHGRHCNRTSRGENGCETLCCGRGYNTIRTVEETKCRCQFHWCCRVTCDKCITRTETHICK